MSKTHLDQGNLSEGIFFRAVRRMYTHQDTMESVVTVGQTAKIKVIVGQHEE